MISELKTEHKDKVISELKTEHKEKVISELKTEYKEKVISELKTEYKEKVVLELKNEPREKLIGKSKNKEIYGKNDSHTEDKNIKAKSNYNQPNEHIKNISHEGFKHLIAHKLR